MHTSIQIASLHICRSISYTHYFFAFSYFFDTQLSYYYGMQSVDAKEKHPEAALDAMLKGKMSSFHLLSAMGVD